MLDIQDILNALDILDILDILGIPDMTLGYNCSFRKVKDFRGLRMGIGVGLKLYQFTGTGLLV